MFSKKNKISIILSIIFISLIIFSSLAIAGTEIEETVKTFDKQILVGLIEIFYGNNNLRGDMEAIQGSESFQEELNTGRVSFYLKGKIKGKYLLTAWLDTDEKQLDQLFKNLDERELDNPFAQIKPEEYYPVYGDNSSINSDVNTAGKFYIAIESDRLQTLWGSYKINFKENTLIDYNRSFYGFNFDYDSKFSVDTFWQQKFSLHSQDELELTGGKLYYLRHDNLVRGSQNLKIELRDVSTGRVEQTITLRPGIDYEINYLQGRIILKKSIDRLVKSADTNLIEDETGENKYYLLADYDYDYDYEEDGREGYGLETSYQLTEQLSVSGTYLRKQRKDGQTYKIRGASIVYNPSSDKGDKFQLNWARSQNVLSGRYTSDDGGITYKEIPISTAGDTSDEATAWDMKYKTVFKNQKDRYSHLDLYYSKKEAGFTSGTHYISEDQERYGLELVDDEGKTSKSFAFDKKIEGKINTDIYSLALSKEYSDNLELSGGFRLKKITKTKTEHSLLGALGFDYTISENKNIYGSQQLTIDKSDEMSRNNITELGAEITKGKWSFNVSGKAGDSESLNFGTGYRYNKNSEVYINTESIFDEDGGSTETAVGAESAINEDVDIYGEYRVDNAYRETATSNVLGVDYTPKENWQLSFDFTSSEVKREQENNFDRNIVSLSTSYNDDNIKFDNNLEYREDKDTVNLTQLLVTGDLSWNYNDKLRLLSEIEYLKEKEKREKEYMEGTFGLAYRPVEMDRLNLIGKYTYLKGDNIRSEADEFDISNYPAEKAQVFSLDAIYDLNAKWQIAEKLAYKNGEVKLNSINDKWTSSETYLWINRLNYQLREDIELFTEYRILENKLAEDKRSGFLIGGYKKFDNNLKLGVGYNFTDFNDDLTDLSYEAEGFFINVIKAW